MRGTGPTPPTPGKAGADAGRAMATRDRDGRLRPGGSAREGGRCWPGWAPPGHRAAAPGGPQHLLQKGGHGCCFRHIPQQLWLAVSAAAHSITHTVHGNTRASHGTGTAWPLRRRYTNMHGHCTGTVWSLHQHCMDTANSMHGHCTGTVWPLHHHYTSIHGHCIATATSVAWPPHRHRMAQHGHRTSIAPAHTALAPAPHTWALPRCRSPKARVNAGAHTEQG